MEKASECSQIDGSHKEILASEDYSQLEDALNISSVFPIPTARRKSRLTCGRNKSSNVEGVAIPNLCESIDSTLPPEERLSHLLKSAFKFCLSSVVQEFCASDEVLSNTLTEKGLQYYESVERDIEQKDTCKSIVKSTNEEKLQEDTFQPHYSCLDSLKKESEDWDELFMKMRKDLKDVAHSCPKPDTDDSHNPEEVKKFDYTDILLETASTAVEFKLHESSLAEVGNMVEFCKHVFPKHTKNITDRVCAHMAVGNTESPRTLLRRL